MHSRPCVILSVLTVRFTIAAALAAGMPQGCNYCGYGDESYWSRGAAWAIYGFAIAYSYTGNRDYLETAMRLADDFIRHIQKTDDVPIWDFKLPEGEEAAIDTSAAAVAANGFLLLAKQAGKPEYHAWAEKIYCRLTGTYVTFDASVEGTLREQNGKHQYASYGDYFYFELLCNLTNGDRKLCW